MRRLCVCFLNATSHGARFTRPHEADAGTVLRRRRRIANRHSIPQKRSGQSDKKPRIGPCGRLADRYSAASRCFGFGSSGASGEVAEWLKAHAWKVCRRETVSRVRIPLSPPAIVFPRKSGARTELWLTFPSKPIRGFAFPTHHRPSALPARRRSRCRRPSCNVPLLSAFHDRSPT